MLKLNNKGFAFSTILYGLMIMGMMIMVIILSTMQTNRQTNKAFVEQIEQELNRYSLTETEFAKSDGLAGQEYIVPTEQSGWYKIELWGSQGGKSGGYGSYTSGLIWLGENTHLYFYIGKQGDNYNGGGTGAGGCGTGGGATDVRLQEGNWDDVGSLKSRIMVAAGGGGACDTGAGAGGAIIGLNGSGTNGGSGGAQSSGSFGKGTNASGKAGGGGGGYYGGNAGTSNAGGGGGSSYISGYAGVATTGSSGENLTYNSQAASTYSSYTNAIFINGLLLEGVNKGDGKAKIVKISSNDKNTPPTIFNSNIYGKRIRYIKDCVDGTMKSDSKVKNAWKQIQVISGGKNIAYNKSMKINNSGTNYNSTIANGKLEFNSTMTSTSTGSQCMYVDLGSVKTNITEIAVWHDFYNANTSAINHTISVGESTGSMTNITKSSSNSLDSVETSNGQHYSALQINSTAELKDGTYYIMSAASDNRFVTNKSGLGKDCVIDYFTGEANQKWTFRKIDSTYYQITSAHDSETLMIMNGTNLDESSVGIDEFRGNYAWNKWKVIAAGNGTYYIESEYGTRLGFTNSNYYNPSSAVLRSQNKAEPSSNTKKNRAQRFKLLVAEY